MNKRMEKLIKKANQRMAKVQAAIDRTTAEGSSGGGVVKAVVSGKMALESLAIDPLVVSTGDVDLLQDLIVAAVNDGSTKAREMSAIRMNAIRGPAQGAGLNNFLAGRR